MNKEREMYEKIIHLIERKGTKFTTDELASELKISKRTLYTLFPNKVAIINETIDFVFYEFRDSWEAEALEGKTSLSDLLKCQWDNFPDNYDVDKLIKFAVKIRNDYPEQWAKLEENIDETSELIYKVLIENEDIRVLTSTEKKVLQMLVRQTFRCLLGENYLEENGLNFKETVMSLLRMILFGIQY
ncbi:MAG: TetR/AcrR family transcriptional regulator [Liquorilactobacillus hordei]|uniref:TetR/AcrR family transcriptional regulator n=1 Tax=Liquorilactobacillus hordei TaxID=468911 RepID=UPI0039EA1E6B